MKFEVEKRDGGVVFRLAGKLRGFAGGEEILDEVRERLADGDRMIVLDLGEVERMDSSGIGVMAAIVTSVENAKATVRFADLPEQVTKVMTIVGLARVLKVFPTVGEALAAPPDK